MLNETMHEDGVLELVIARPPVNAFDLALLEALAVRLEAVESQPQVRAVVLRAEGGGFCGGGDVKEVERLEGFAGILGQTAGSLRLSLALLRCAAPVVVAVHGYCVGVGVLAAASADILVATRDARFVLAEIDNGATAGGVQALRLMPEKRVRAAMMTAEPVTGEDLHRLGGVYRLADTPEDGADQARVLAATIAAKPSSAMRRLKRSLNNTAKVHEVEAAYRAEISYTYELNIMGEAGEGRRAFISGERSGYAG